MAKQKKEKISEYASVIKVRHKPSVSQEKIKELADLQKLELLYNKRLREPQKPLDYLSLKPWLNEDNNERSEKKIPKYPKQRFKERESRTVSSKPKKVAP